MVFWRMALLVSVLGLAWGCSGGEVAGNAESMAKADMMAASGEVVASRQASPEGPSEPTTPRQVIRTARLTLRVVNVEASEREVNRLVTSMRGYVEGSTSGNLDSARPEMTLETRIPVGRFEAYIAALEKLGTRRSKQIESEDVTGQVIDLEARLRNMQAEEQSLRTLLARAQRLSDIIALTDRLSVLRGQIDSLDGQRKSVMGQAAMSRVIVTLEQGLVTGKDKDPNWLEQGWLEAVNSLGGILRGLVTALIWIVVFSPLWGGVVYIVRKQMRNASKSDV